LSRTTGKGSSNGDKHRRLVRKLIDELSKKGVRVLTADCEGYLKPHKQGRHAPDIVGEHSNGLLVIGEAKLCEDLVTVHTYEQFSDFSNRQMEEGPLAGSAVPFHIITPMECSPRLHTILRDLELENRDNIHIWLSG